MDDNAAQPEQEAPIFPEQPADPPRSDNNSSVISPATSPTSTSPRSSLPNVEQPSSFPSSESESPTASQLTYTPPAKTKPKGVKVALFAIILIVIAGVTFAAGTLYRQFSNQKPESGETTAPEMEIIMQRGTLIIGTDATYPPMEYYDAQENLIGHDIDLGNRIAEKIGVAAQFRNITWDDIFTSLENGEVDMIISSVSITQERQEKYAFSEPYLNAGQVIITNKSENSISSTDDLDGKRIAVQKDTTNEEQALIFTQEDMVLRFDDFQEATQALLEGEADAIFSDLTNAKGIVADNPELKIASDPFTSEFYGIVIRKNEEGLLTAVNDALNDLKQQGILVYLKQKWLE